MPSFQTVQPANLASAYAANPTLDLVDVRQPGEFLACHARGARNIPLANISVNAIRSSRPGNAIGPVYVICQSGGRSQRACTELVNQGMTDIVNITGGTAAWRQAGLPTEESPQTPFAGPMIMRFGLLLALVCAALGMFVHPAFAYAAMGIWIALLLLGRGACPLGNCSLPPKRNA